MRFSCGKTDNQKFKDRLERIAREKQWHRVFLFWPKTIEEKDGRKICYWLQQVEKRMVHEGDLFYSLPVYEYRPINK